MSKPLSPAAQAVKDAALAMYAGPNVRRLAWPLDMPVVIAALCAAADQVAPACRVATGGDYAAGANNERIVIRNQLFAVAAELEAQS